MIEKLINLLNVVMDDVYDSEVISASLIEHLHRDAHWYQYVSKIRLI